MFTYLLKRIKKIQELTNIKKREIKKEAFQDNEKALNLLRKCESDYFKPQELLQLARNFRWCAIYINFNDRLMSKIEPDTWIELMSKYSWDAALKHNQNVQRNTPTMY